MDIPVAKVLRTLSYMQIHTRGVRSSDFQNHLHSFEIHQFLITLHFQGFIDNCATTQFLDNQLQYFHIFLSPHKPSSVKHSWLTNYGFTTHVIVLVEPTKVPLAPKGQPTNPPTSQVLRPSKVCLLWNFHRGPH